MIAKCWILCLYEYMKSVLNCKFRIHNSGWKIPRMTGNQLEFTLTETHVSHGIQYCGNMSRKDLLNFLYCLLLERMFHRIIWNISQHFGKICQKWHWTWVDFAVFGGFSTPYFGYFEGAETFFLKDVVESNGVVRKFEVFWLFWYIIHGMTSPWIVHYKPLKYWCPHFVAERQNNCLGEPYWPCVQHWKLCYTML